MNKRIDELIIKQHQQKINETESRELNDWISESAENKHYVQQTLAIFNVPDFPDQESIPELKLDFTVIEKKKMSYPIFISLAALFLIALTSVFWFTRTEQIVLTSYKQISQFQLPDGSEITMNITSNLGYTAEFNKTVRQVKFTGEAFFNIKRNENKPFIIICNQHSITVLGTSFNVRNSGDTTSVSVRSGKVEIQTVNNSIILEKGQSATVINDQINLKKTLLAEYEIAEWKSPFWTIRDEYLIDIFHFLEKRYSVKIIRKDATIDSLKIYGNFSKNSIHSILETIADLNNLKLSTFNSTYLLEKKP